MLFARPLSRPWCARLGLPEKDFGGKNQPKVPCQRGVYWCYVRLHSHYRSALFELRGNRRLSWGLHSFDGAFVYGSRGRRAIGGLLPEPKKHFDKCPYNRARASALDAVSSITSTSFSACLCARCDDGCGHIRLTNEPSGRSSTS